MRSTDFLNTEAETKLREDLIAAGAACSLWTNSEDLLQATRETFLNLAPPHGPVDFSMRLWVDDKEQSQPPWPAPYVRGLSHLVFASFDEGSTLLADLRRRHVIGRLSRGMAADHSYCMAVLFPMLLTIVSASVGIAELHCACVAKGDRALLLAGPSGSGKSTLSLALSQQGFGFISDDRSFCSLGPHAVQVWGLPTRLKLRPEAASWFPELRAMRVSTSAKGTPELWIEPERLKGIKRVQQSRPTWLIFLEQRDSTEFKLSRVSSEEALRRLEPDLTAELPDATARRTETLQRIVQLPCWLLRYGGDPQLVAQRISGHIAPS